TFELRSMLARLAGYAHLQLGHGAKARGHLDDALAIAREGDDSYQIGLTLEAIERNDAGAQDERTAIFAQLGIVRTPAIP
ncbi:MAG: hypothetical protein KJN73_07765, partial [Acidimicrobiia bacterium]|nr:hypothetical protein [Acidimicrobiia bacterium]